MGDWKKERGEMEIRKNEQEFMEKARQRNIEEKLDELIKLESDVDRWKWAIENKDMGFVVMMDNDDTYIHFKGEQFEFLPEKKRIVDFGYYLGNSEGAYDLLKAIGINAEPV